MPNAIKIKAFKSDDTSIEFIVSNPIQVSVISNKFQRWEYIYE